MSPSAIIHTPAIASLVAMRPSIFVFPVCDLTPRIRYFLRVWGEMNWIPVAEWRPNFPYGGYELASGARIFLLKRSGHVTAVLGAGTRPRDGARWVENDNNLSLQNLLTGCFAFSAARDVPLPGRLSRARP